MTAAARGKALRATPFAPYEFDHRSERRSQNKARHTLIHSRPLLRRLPPLAHDSSGAVAQFYFGADTQVHIVPAVEFLCGSGRHLFVCPGHVDLSKGAGAEALALDALLGIRSDDEALLVVA